MPVALLSKKHMGKRFHNTDGAIVPDVLSENLNSSMDSSDTMLPHLSGFPNVNTPTGVDTSSATLPPASVFPSNGTLSSTLSDLSLAAFVESLYTLEIAPSDGLTANMLGGSLMSARTSDAEQGMMPDLIPTSNYTSENKLVQQEHWQNQMEFAKSAFLDERLAFSVPSDMRWWNTAWSLPHSNELLLSSMPGSNKDMTTKLDCMSPFEIQDATSPTTPQTTTSFEKELPNDQPIKSPLGSGLGTVNMTSGRKLNLLLPSDTCLHGYCNHAGDDMNASPVTEMSLTGESHATEHVDHCPDKVHCVPSPDGTHCSCTSSSGLSFLSLERSIRSRIQAPDQEADKSPENKALSSLVFTLTMSQSVSKQCNCSTDCPTCKSSPSYKSSGAVLISTALQIYARALQLFHEMLASDGSHTCSCSGSRGNCDTSCKCCARVTSPDATQSSMEVRIGDYMPSAQNSRKIALYALKLELYDLERAMARVQHVSMQPLQRRPGTFCASEINSASQCCGSHKAQESSEHAASSLLLNPFDQLVIRKLHSQLNEALHAVEQMEVKDDNGI